jgi:hypothetical protein
VTSLKRSIFILLILFFYNTNTVYAQLWRYLNDSPASEKAADRALKKEASSVTTKETVTEDGPFPYDIITYSIKAFDGSSAKISLWEKPFSDHTFHIELPGDTLIIPDFYSLAKVHHLSNNLLEIVYSPRGGSDDGFDNVLILGVNKNKVCIVMEIQSIHEFDNVNLYGLYNLHLKLLGTNTDDYRMQVNVRDLLKSDDKSKKSHDWSYHYALKYDKDKHIFYTGKQKIDAVIYGDTAITQKHEQQHVSAVCPVIYLGGYKYCFYNNIWYEIGKYGSDDVTLFNYSFRN